ncbi:C-C motif chemokine 19-like [Echeneis naucrates]|uniref:C-C motif chemokine 19-like n=1 Tax=Echeneis naucrates TaxID=173247 RepID=A0A665WPE1_ECHNA|nr:C-C motif chemokine 19-like [Echeneis naucrates]
MAPRGDAKLFLSILFIACCCSVALAQIPMDCCLSIKNQTVSKHAIRDYRHQLSGHGCSISATILVGKRGKTLCVPLGEAWVEEVVRYMDHLRKVCKTNKKMKKCARVNIN